MKLKYEFETVDMGDEAILVPMGIGAKQVHGIVKLNDSGLEIIDLIKTNASENAVVDVLDAKYENNREELERFVHCVVGILRENGLIDA